MKKEEILEASKKENKNKDIYATEIALKGANYASICTLILTGIYFAYEIFTGKGQNPALYSIIAIYNSVFYGYRTIKIKENKTINMITSILWGFVTIVLIISYFKNIQL